MKKILAALAAMLMLFTTGCEIDTAGGTKAKGAKHHTSSDVSPASDDSASSDPEPSFYHPTKSDFRAMLKVTSRSCFGSAGCNLEYKLGIAWEGPTGVTLDKSYDVYLRVTGGDMGVDTQTITVSRKLRYRPIDGYGSTGSTSARLHASVVRIGNANGF